MFEALLAAFIVWCAFNWALARAIRKARTVWFEAGYRAGVAAAQQHSAPASSLADNAKTS